MKKDVLENIDEGLYELDIFFPTKEFLENNYYYEKIENKDYKKDYPSTSELNDGLYFDSKMKCIVKVQKGKNYVEEINTGLKIPLVLLEREINVYKKDWISEQQAEDKRYYSIKKSRKIPSYFVVLAKTKHNFYHCDIYFSPMFLKSHTSFDFISKRNDNLFSYNDDEYYAIMNNYEFGQKELKKLESQEQKTRENLLIINELKRMPDGIKRYINYGDSNKLQGYKRYFKNGNKK